MNGIDAARSAWARALSARIDAQFMSLLLICSITTSAGAPTVAAEVRPYITFSLRWLRAGWLRLPPTLKPLIVPVFEVFRRNAGDRNGVTGWPGWLLRWRYVRVRRRRREQPAGAAASPRPDRPRLRRATRHRGARGGLPVLARAVHHGLRRCLRGDARPVPDPPPGRAGVRAAALGQPDRDRDLHAGRVQQPRFVQPPVRRHRGTVRGVVS